MHLEHATAFGELVHRDCPDLHVVSLDQRVLTPAVLLEVVDDLNCFDLRRTGDGPSREY